MAGGDEDDGSFMALPPSVQQKIDDAFDSTIHSRPPSSHPPKRRKLGRDHSPPQSCFIPDNPPPGGFLVDQLSPGGFVHGDDRSPGGFLDDRCRPSEYQGKDESHIPLTLIPTALQLLGLEADEDVLSVFRNAASGWNHGTSPDDGHDGLVGRRDWRAVCAALLDTGSVGDDMDMNDALSWTWDGGNAVVGDGSDSGEEYVQSVDSDSDDGVDGSDDDYQEGGLLGTKSERRGTRSKTVSASTQTRRGRGRDGKSATISSEDDKETSGAGHGLSARQKMECRAAFALFFADSLDDTLDERRIGIKDINRVAAVLKEKISADEVMEMLAAFSTAPDRSMGLGDFERMMVAAKMA